MTQDKLDHYRKNWALHSAEWLTATATSQSLFSTATSSAHKSFKRAARIAQVLLDSQKNACLLHGDIHHENVLQSKRGWLAIDPKGLVGENTYDAANTLCNPVSMPNLVLKEGRIRRNAELLSRELNIDRERLLAFTFVHAALSASWHQHDRHYEHFALAGGLVMLLDSMVPHFN